MNELDKWANVHDDVVVIEEFLQFLCHKEISLCFVGKYDHFYPIPNTRDLIYSHFGIDKEKLERERRALISDLANQPECSAP